MSHPRRVRSCATSLAALLFAGAVWAVGAVHAQSAARPIADHLVFVTIDGLRWQEFFTGADRDYFKRPAGGGASEAEQRFWRPTAAERRTVLMPFIWKTVAAQGQIYGDPGAASTARFTNGLWFSYPGYSEMFAGVADSRVDSNRKVPNPNLTVLEFLNGRPGFERRVAAFGAWDVLPFILNAERSRLPVGSGWTPVPSPSSDRERAINELASDLPRYWSYGPFDAPMVYAAIEALRSRQPRMLYLMLGETDEWAHDGRYELYLDAAWRSDRFIERIWNTIQSLPEYRDRTALVLATDHGRGATTKDWTDHGRDIAAADRSWIALMGPGIAPLGVRREIDVTASQIAATIAALVGEDFRAAVPAAAPPLPVRP